MSYRSGFQALVKRFTDRFPEGEYRYVVSLRSDYNEASHIFTELKTCNWGGDIQSITIYHRPSDVEVCRIDGNTLFGIRLSIRSEYLKKDLHLHRRPLRLIFQNQHGMRHWLQNKPKFAQLGSSVASQIYFAYAVACLSCETSPRKYVDGLCEDCNHVANQVSDMLNEGGAV